MVNGKLALHFFYYSRKSMHRILVFGTFDHFHPGHRYLLDAASERGCLHIVVARDETVQKIKGQLPDHSQEERMQVLRAAYPQAEIILGSDGEYLQPVMEIAPDLILLGYDQRMPPGVTEADLPCPVERMDALEPERYKSSLVKSKIQNPKS